MNLRRLSSQLFIGAAFVLAITTACGSDNDGGGNQSATGGGAGASTTGGSGATPSSGGSSGTNATTGGTSAQGGSNGIPSGAGEGGVGGEGPGPGPGPGFGCPAEQPTEGDACTRAGNSACVYDEGGCVCTDGAWQCYADSDCPSEAPADAASCDLGGMQCTFDDLSCSCNADSGWSCTSACPATKPGDDATCRRAATSTCRYDGSDALVTFGGMTTTTCACSDGTFSCFTAEDCPESAPATDDACGQPTLSCTYDDRSCSCTGDGAWTCQTDCPDATPDDGTACERSVQNTCRYDADDMALAGPGQAAQTCVCSDGEFTCWGQDDCPEAIPENASSCGFASLACAYDTGSCTCANDNTWNCVLACPAAVPADDSACQRPATQPCRYAEGALLSGGFGTTPDAICTCNDSAFDCVTQDDCPESAPEAGGTCDLVANFTCSYESESCTCSGMNGWNCTTNCPAAPPDAGTECNRSANAACRYDAGGLLDAGSTATATDTCLCLDNAFTCYTPADCPADLPESNTACELPGFSCAYDDQTCRCNAGNDMWTCRATPVIPGAGGAGGAAGVAGASGVDEAGGAGGAGG